MVWLRALAALILGHFIVGSVQGQHNISVKDSIDHRLDLSDWVVKAHGFFPMPVIITEPALGNFGGGLAPIFISANRPYIDTVRGKVVRTRVKPNLLALFGAYTANGSWIGGGGAAGVIRKWRANYRIGSGFANINMNFYRILPNGQEVSNEFTIRMLPIYGQLIKQLPRSQWYAGLNYLFLKMELKNPDPRFIDPLELNRTISRLGVLAEYDGRDNVFTPDRGIRWNLMFASSASELGSDYSFTSGFTGVYGYVPITQQLVAGFRAEYQEVWGAPPFYMLPFVNLRGIPVARYQGQRTLVAETEWRWDLTMRQSLVVFGGAGTAVSRQNENTIWHAAGGAGWRYLIARKLKLRTGIDIARGPENWAYYLVFGTNWVR